MGMWSRVLGTVHGCGFLPAKLRHNAWPVHLKAQLVLPRMDKPWQARGPGTKSSSNHRGFAGFNVPPVLSLLFAY